MPSTVETAYPDSHAICCTLSPFSTRRSHPAIRNLVISLLKLRQGVDEIVCLVNKMIPPSEFHSTVTSPLIDTRPT